jgi:predicted CxxxxCH...CXXCH cytochrome family protein
MTRAMTVGSWRGALAFVVACSAALVVASCGGTESGQPVASDSKLAREPAMRAALTATRTGGAIQTPFLAMNSTASGTGVHVSHPSYTCSVCHLVGGAVQFDPRGPAIIAGTLATDSTGKVIVDSSGHATILVSSQLPSYDPVGGTCSNVACHYMKAGVYVPQDYYPPDGYSYPYGGSSLQTPDWYSTPGTDACTACHGYPPTGNGGVWHSGWHGGVNVTSTLNPDVLGYNACSTCHPDVSTTITGAGTSTGAFITTFTTPSMHANGTVDVLYYNPARTQGPSQDSCDGCHFGY